mmetsp:Transcript_19280/g.56569  ORF Transcript_19280/g.56569 Transcript_19280/m.56569 type:complete len:81 (-) Transcript_19280:759-1001(-)
MHGKNICDAALSNLPSNANTEALRSDDFIFSGSRNVVIDLTGAGDPGCRKVVQGGLVGNRAHLLRLLSALQVHRPCRPQG